MQQAQPTGEVQIECYSTGTEFVYPPAQQELKPPPIHEALRAHFLAYDGVLSPRAELADVALRTGPQGDDL